MDSKKMPKMPKNAELFSCEMCNFNCSKLSNYKLLKENFECENYVKMNLNKYVRSVIAQFRAGSLPIEIELGRYQRIPRENRICKQCKMNCVESELHFLFHCDKHSVLRSDLIQKLYTICSVDSTEIEKLKYLLTHDQLISKTGHFIINALKNRI